MRVELGGLAMGSLMLHPMNHRNNAPVALLLHSCAIVVIYNSIEHFCILVCREYVFGIVSLLISILFYGNVFEMNL